MEGLDLLKGDVFRSECFSCALVIGHVHYILVGAGTTSFAAAKAIREKDPQAKVRRAMINIA